MKWLHIDLDYLVSAQFNCEIAIACFLDLDLRVVVRLHQVNLFGLLVEVTVEKLHVLFPDRTVDRRLVGGALDAGKES